MYKALFILGITAGVAGLVGLSSSIYAITNFQQIASSGNASYDAHINLANLLALGIIFTGLVVSCLGAGLGAWAYGKRNDQKSL